MTSSEVLGGSVEETCIVLYWPAGVNSRLPSGANDKRLKNEVNVSLAYRLAFLIPSVLRAFSVLTPGDGASSGLTAGSGMDAAGDADRRIDDDENDDRRL